MTVALTGRLRGARSVIATASGVHYSALAVVGLMLVVASFRSWFFFDDWSILVPSHSIIWMPHVGHWSTTPWLIFLGLRNVFGLNSYLPFALTTIVTQLAFAHLLWRFCVRVGVLPWLATAFSLLVMLFGDGAENILWAFQIGFVGAMSLGLLVIVILMKEALGIRDWIAIIAASTVAMSCSGTAIPMLIVAALIGWSRHGFVRTVGLFIPAASAYLIWYILIGHTAEPNGRASGVLDLFYRVPPFAISMLTDGLGRALPIAALGALIFALVVIWGVLSYRDAETRTRPAHLLFVAAPLFALVTAYSRVGLGIESATSSRYLFFVISVMLPLMGLALGSLIRRLQLPLGAVVVLLLVVVVYNCAGLVGALVVRDGRSADTKEHMSASASVESAYPRADPTSFVGGKWAPDVTLSDLRTFVKNGWFAPGSFSTMDQLSARANLGLEVVGAMDPPSQSTCRSLASDGSSSTFPGGEVLIHVSTAASVWVALTEGNATGDAKWLAIPEGWSTVRLGGTVPEGIQSVVSTGSPGVLVCSVS